MFHFLETAAAEYGGSKTHIDCESVCTCGCWPAVAPDVPRCIWRDLVCRRKSALQSLLLDTHTHTHTRVHTQGSGLQMTADSVYSG